MTFTGSSDGSGANSGSAVINFYDSTLTIQDCVISGNATNGITNYGTLEVSGSTISDNQGLKNHGGGIRVPIGNDRITTIVNSTISGNSSNEGGGIYSSGTVTIRNSTISGNSAFIKGGGISQESGSLTIHNSIIAGNLYGSSPSDIEGFPAPASSYNLVGNILPAGGLVNGAGGNIVGVDPALVLGPLADNGGPTPTHALLPGSPAINAGDPYFNPATAGIPFDQRGSGFARVLGAPGAANDYVGLAEIKFGTTLGAVITPTDVFASTYFSGGQAPTNLINDSGLDTSSGNVLTYTHAADLNAIGMWHAGAGQGTGGAAPAAADQYLVIDLGANEDLSQAYLWQMVQTGLLGRGIKEFRLLASPDAPDPADAANPPAVYDLTGFTEILGVTQLAADPQGGAAPTQAFDLTGATNVRQIYIDVSSSYNTGRRIDIGAFEILQGDYDLDGDVDGRDFLVWQRGGSPNSLSSSDLDVWEVYYGDPPEVGGIADFGTQRVPEIAESEESLPLQAASTLGAPLAVSRARETGLHGDSKTSGVDAVMIDSYVEQVDREMEQLATVPSGVRSFGEMVARRVSRRR